MKIIFILSLLGLLIACDGIFRVKRDIEFVALPSEACIRQAILKALPETTVGRMTRNNETIYSFEWKTSGKRYFAEALPHIVAGKPVIELATGGATSPTRAAIEENKKAGDATLAKVADQLRQDCQSAVSEKSRTDLAPLARKPSATRL